MDFKYFPVANLFVSSDRLFDEYAYHTIFYDAFSYLDLSLDHITLYRVDQKKSVSVRIPRNCRKWKQGKNLLKNDLIFLLQITDKIS